MKHHANLNLESNRRPASHQSGEGVPASGQRRLKSRGLPWLALPLVLALGCASDSQRAAADDHIAITGPAPAAPTSSGRPAVNPVVDREAFVTILVSSNANYGLTAAVNKDGVVRVSLCGTALDQNRQQNLAAETRKLDGVTQVKNDRGADVALTAPTSSGRLAVNQVVGREVFEMFLVSSNVNYGQSAVVNNDGVVSLSSTALDQSRRQNLVDETRKLDGVTQVKNDRGADVAPTPAIVAVVDD